MDRICAGRNFHTRVANISIRELGYAQNRTEYWGMYSHMITVTGSRPSDCVCWDPCLSRSQELDHAEGVLRHGCVRWSLIRVIWAWRDWPLPGRWPDGDRRSTVAWWTRRRAAPVYTPKPDLTFSPTSAVPLRATAIIWWVPPWLDLPIVCILPHRPDPRAPHPNFIPR